MSVCLRRRCRTSNGATGRVLAPECALLRQRNMSVGSEPSRSAAAVQYSDDPDPGSVLITFPMPPTPDGSTTTDDATMGELPVDILQLLEESERHALELLRTSSVAIRKRLHGREQRKSTSPAALKALLDEQAQWLKATLDRTSSLEALETASEARSTGRCCHPPWLGARTIIGDRHALTRRFKHAPLESAYRSSLHRPWKRRIRLLGLFYLVHLAYNAYSGTADWRKALDQWHDHPRGQPAGAPPSEADLVLTLTLTLTRTRTLAPTPTPPRGAGERGRSLRDHLAARAHHLVRHRGLE